MGREAWRKSLQAALVEESAGLKGRAVTDEERQIISHFTGDVLSEFVLSMGDAKRCWEYGLLQLIVRRQPKGNDFLYQACRYLLADAGLSSPTLEDEKTKTNQPETNADKQEAVPTATSRAKEVSEEEASKRASTQAPVPVTRERLRRKKKQGGSTGNGDSGHSGNRAKAGATAIAGATAGATARTGTSVGATTRTGAAVGATASAGARAGARARARGTAGARARARGTAGATARARAKTGTAARARTAVGATARAGVTTGVTATAGATVGTTARAKPNGNSKKRNDKNKQFQNGLAAERAEKRMNDQKDLMKRFLDQIRVLNSDTTDAKLDSVGNEIEHNEVLGGSQKAELASVLKSKREEIVAARAEKARAAAEAAARAEKARADAIAAAKKPVQNNLFGTISVAKLVCFILDASGSMRGGGKDAFVRQETINALRAMPNGSTFAILSYGDVMKNFKGGACSHIPGDRANAEAWLGQLRFNGSTENAMPDCLRAAMALPNVGEIHLLCDGGGVGKKLGSIHPHVPVHTVYVEPGSRDAIDGLKDVSSRTNGRYREKRCA